MKKVLVKGVLEESKFYCDKHPEIECFSELKTASWYGSSYDLQGIEIHLCDECLKDFYKLIQEKFNVTPKEIEI